MVFVKVRETYDLHTLRNKMTVIGIHTPKSSIVKRNYPGLLLQCKGWRPVAADVRLACASMLPLDPLGVGTTEGDVAPEDVFNPILYKAVSNFSMSQIEQMIHLLGNSVASTPASTDGESIISTNNGITSDDFDIYYGLLADTHGWKHANPQSGLSMSGLRPLVYEVLQNIGDNKPYSDGNGIQDPSGLNPDGKMYPITPQAFRGKAHPLPILNTLQYKKALTEASDYGALPLTMATGFDNQLKTGSTSDSFNRVFNDQVGVPSPKVFCGCIIVPPSRLHQLFYRLVCEWTLEFVGIRALSDVVSWTDLASMGASSHWIDYDFGESKLVPEETSLVDTSDGSGIKKVM